VVKGVTVVKVAVGEAAAAAAAVVVVVRKHLKSSKE
jgi:hypothetical protein